MSSIKDGPHVIFGEPFQWHLPSSKHDKTPCCNGGSSLLPGGARCCKVCKQTYTLGVNTEKWLPLARKLGEARALEVQLKAEMLLLLRGPEPQLCAECGELQLDHHDFRINQES